MDTQTIPPPQHTLVLYTVTHTPRARPHFNLRRRPRGPYARRDLAQTYYVESTRRGEPATHAEDAEGAFGVADLGRETCSSLVLVCTSISSSPPPPCFVGGGGHHGIKKHVTRGRFRGTCTVVLSTMRIDGILILLKSVGGGGSPRGAERMSSARKSRRRAAPDAASARAARSTRRRTASSGSPASGNQRRLPLGRGRTRARQLRRGK